MKTTILSLIIAIVLTGCSLDQFCKKDDPVISHQISYKKIPPELLEIPEMTSSPTGANSQKDVSLWLIENEKRTKSLENQLQKIKEYNDKE